MSFTEEQKRAIARLMPDLTAKEIATRLGLNWRAVQGYVNFAHIRASESKRFKQGFRIKEFSPSDTEAALEELEKLG